MGIRCSRHPGRSDPFLDLRCPTIADSFGHRPATRRLPMLHARQALALLLVAWTPPALAQADLPIRDTTLANGLQVIVIENHAVPLVTMELDVKNGGYTQTPEYEGLAH